MKKYKDIEVGDKYGRLTVLELDKERTNSHKKKEKFYICCCDCGNITSVYGYKLKTGLTQSCGCLQKENSLKALRKYNKFNLDGEYGIGYTVKGEEFYFDLEDYDKIKEYYWYIDVNGYPVTRSIINPEQPKTAIKLHNFLMKPSKDKFIDHRNRKRNDDRKENLFEVTRGENAINKSMRSDNTQGFIGVGYDKRREKYFGYINLNGKRKYLGYCKSKEEAIVKRLQAEYDIFGEELAPQRHLFKDYGIPQNI